SFFWLIPVFLKYHWVVSTTNRYLPGFACRTFLAGFGVDDGHIVSGDRFTHAPRLGRKPFPAVCYEEIRFRLAVEFVYNDTGEFLVGPIEDLRRKRFTARTHGTKREVVFLLWILDPHQQPNCGRRDECIRHLEFLQQRKRHPGVELPHRIAHDGPPIVPCRKQQVAERADPRPIGGGPVDTVVDSTLEVHREGGAMADPDTVPVEHTF